MSKENKLIPDLRFHEFKHNEEWSDNNLEQIAIFLKGKGLAKSDIVSNGKNLCIHYGELFTKYSEVINKVDSSTNLEDGFYSIANDVLMPTSDMTPTGLAKASCIKLDDILLGGDILVIRTDNSKFEGEFLSRFIRHREREVLKFVTGTTVYHLYASGIGKLSVQYPEIEEQQKIASCLSSLDELITAHNHKLQALKIHKKGLMQNLFPQEGEKVPKFRFPEFEKDGEWMEQTLEKLAVITKGKGISKSDIVENGNLPCIRYGELYTEYSETISDIKSYTNIDGENLVLSEENDVIIPASGETHIDIARASCVMKKGVALGGDLNIIKTKINGVFLAYYLNNVKKRAIAQIAQGISVVHLYANQLKTLVLSIPRPKEQQKIAVCLSTLDELIKAQSEKIKYLQQHKKGLMQGLFPKLND